LPHVPIQFELRSMRAEALAADTAWLEALVADSPLLPEAVLRRHWRRVIAWLPLAARDELAEILLSVETA
jgi:hypothetical protein